MAAATVYLEFFFDGSPEEIQDQEEVFKQAFEHMIEEQLQEQRVTQFRQKLAARRRRGQGSTEAGDEEWIWPWNHERVEEELQAVRQQPVEPPALLPQATCASYRAEHSLNS
ncbi:unnamed protein product [Durusdinium trenchii]|uniref:Uncharacterized protein n=1 Tax=Durusdinium trenchii TaxID=1381693 RepID=A0ABP0P8X2_9DINO